MIRSRNNRVAPRFHKIKYAPRIFAWGKDVLHYLQTQSHWEASVFSRKVDLCRTDLQTQMGKITPRLSNAGFRWIHSKDLIASLGQDVQEPLPHPRSKTLSPDSPFAILANTSKTVGRR